MRGDNKRGEKDEELKLIKQKRKIKKKREVYPLPESYAKTSSHCPPQPLISCAGFYTALPDPNRHGPYHPSSSVVVLLYIVRSARSKPTLNTGADPGGGRWGGRPPLGRRDTIQNTPFKSIQAPVQHWAPTPGRNPVSAPAAPEAY